MPSSSSRFRSWRRFILWAGAFVLAALVPDSAVMAGGAAAAGGIAYYYPNPILMALDIVVIVMLASASLASVALIIDAAIHLRAAKIAPVETTRRLQALIEARQFRELMDFTATDASFVSKALYAGVRRAHLGYAAMREGLENSATEQASNLFRRIEMLNVIGNIGPLIGLLGTVLGMIMAFYALHHAGGQARVTDLSAGIATALWHTFGGLAVAIPSLIAFGFFRTRLDKIVTRASLSADELLESLRPSERPPAAAGEADIPAERVENRHKEPVEP